MSPFHSHLEEQVRPAGADGRGHWGHRGVSETSRGRPGGRLRGPRDLLGETWRLPAEQNSKALPPTCQAPSALGLQVVTPQSPPSPGCSPCTYKASAHQVTHLQVQEDGVHVGRQPPPKLLSPTCTWSCLLVRCCIGPPNPQAEAQLWVSPRMECVWRKILREIFK